MLSPPPKLNTSSTKHRPKPTMASTSFDMSMPPLIDPDQRRSYPNSPWPGHTDAPWANLASGGGGFGPPSAGGFGGPSSGGGFGSGAGGGGFGAMNGGGMNGGFGGGGGGAGGFGTNAFGAGGASPYSNGGNSPFLHPPPPGVTSGGQPGFLDAFPGASAGGGGGMNG